MNGPGTGGVDDFRRRVYRYYFLPPEIINEDGKKEEPKEEPLILCPKCKDDLTTARSVEVILSGEKPIKFLTHLDAGVLQDTPVLNILKGGKEEVSCAHCKCSLADLDNVYEEEMTI